jgi:hypothetical protein
MHYTKHAYDRLSRRLAGLVDERQISAAVFECDNLPVGQTGIVIKRLGRVIHREGSSGDLVVAVVERDRNGSCRVVTVELRGSDQGPAWAWKKYLDASYLTA